jgi:tetratricopeptide (TPR) repeat protein
MRTAWLAAIVWMAALSGIAHAQPREDLRDAVSRFEAAWYGGKRSEARVQLCRIYDLDSNEVHRYAEEAEHLFLKGDTPMESSTLDTLVGIYSSAVRHDTLRRTRWLVSRALLLHSHLPASDPRRRSALADAFHGAPLECPLPLIEAFLTDRFELCKRGRITAPMLMRDWIACDDALTQRQVLNPAESRDAAQLQIWSTSRLLETVPDCNSLQKTARHQLQGSPSTEQLQAWYRLLHLRNCTSPSLLDSLEKRVVTPDAAPYWHLAAAQHCLNQERIEEACAHAQRAVSMESNALLKAGNMLMAARLEALRGKPEAARKWLQDASRLHPTWGEPYLRLADLYAEGDKQCRMSKFDQKAIFWASIELCTLAKNVDPSTEEEANRRIVEFQQQMPTAEECSFRGLRPGDTYPLLCWMEITTTVKVK